MKIVASSILILVVSIMFVPALHSQFGPPRPPQMGIAIGSPSPPPGMGVVDPGMPPDIEMKMRTITWFGVQTREVSPEVYAHTDLPEGVGVVVEFIEPNSPAAKAGLARLDIITKFADQLLVNPQQLDTLVRMRRPGEEVELTIVRKARTQKARVVLGKTEVPEDEIMMPGVYREGVMPMNAYPMSEPTTIMAPAPMNNKPDGPRPR